MEIKIEIEVEKRTQVSRIGHTVLTLFVMSRELTPIFQATLIIIVIVITYSFCSRLNLDGIGPKENSFVCGGSLVRNKESSSSTGIGKTLFQSRCATCHNLFKDGTGPALGGFTNRGKWADPNELLKWVRNPAAYMKTDAYTQGLQARFGSTMTAFPEMTYDEIVAVTSYIEETMSRW